MHLTILYYAPGGEREGLGNLALPAGLYLGISRHQSDYNKWHMTAQEHPECK